MTQCSKVSSELIMASLNYNTGDILYTWKLVFPTYILAEINTHRVASRNTSSSRAIPCKRMRQNIWDDPHTPIEYGANQAGMQARTLVAPWKAALAELIYSSGRYSMMWRHWALEKLGVHKQVGNRLLQPWMWTTQIFSVTEVDNLFAQRDHPDAEPHFRKLAGMMHIQQQWAKSRLSDMSKAGVRYLLMCSPFGNKDSYKLTPLNVLHSGEWHLPLINAGEDEAHTLDELKIMSAARCARTSYNKPDTGIPSTIDEDYALYKKLASADPKHLSPFEHQATPLATSTFCGNFRGWRQFRKDIPGESGRKV